MGGGLSTEDSAEMKCAYAEFSALDDPMQVNEEAFREILSRKAPGLYKKADTSGHVEDGARTLRGQFELAWTEGHHRTCSCQEMYLLAQDSLQQIKRILEHKDSANNELKRKHLQPK